MASNALWWIAIFAVAVIGLVVYVNNRDRQASQLQHIASLSQIAHAPATACSYNPSEFGNGTAGTMYIENGRIRIDIKEFNYGGYSAGVEAVLNADGTREMDPATYDRLSSQATGAVDAINLIITQAPWKCSPWWLVNESLFSIPGGVSF